MSPNADPQSASEKVTVERRGGSPAARIARCVRAIRYQDVLVLQGTPTLGALFALDQPVRDSLGPLVLFGLAGFLLMANVFCYNDWAGARLDLEDANKVGDSFLTRGVSRREMLAMAVVQGFLGLPIPDSRSLE